jgi:HK97 family phage major capsid protein
VAEYAAGTVSSPTFDNVSLTARDLMILTLVTNDVNADSIISISDRFAIEAGRAFAYKEDLCGFIGTGISTYGGISGVSHRLTTINGVDSGGGLQAYDTGYAWSNITLADDVIPLIARLPEYADRNAKFYCSRTFYYSVLVKLEVAAGGVTLAELVNGSRVPKFMGYPVVFTEALPTSAATSTVQLLFGDLYMAAQFGDRQQVTIAMNPAAVIGSVSAFERNSMGLRAVERFDINVHDVGSSTAAGCVVGLISHSA